MAPYCGEQVKAAPANCGGLKTYLVCGNPCYTCCSIPVLGSLKNSETFLSAMKQAVNAYQEKHNIPVEQRAIFEDVNDNVFDFGKAKGINAPPGSAPQAVQMADAERTGTDAI